MVERDEPIAELVVVRAKQLTNWVERMAEQDKQLTDRVGEGAKHLADRVHWMSDR